MRPSPSGVAPRFLRTHDAAAFLGLSGRTLEKHRCTGTGPIFRKLGGRVVYAIDDLEAWAAERARNSTSDPGQPPSRDAVPPRSAPTARPLTERSDAPLRRTIVNSNLSAPGPATCRRATRRT